MEITYAFIKSIFDTLSVSYYLGRKIDVVLSKTSKNSFYAPEKDLIVISAPSIARVIFEGNFDRAYIEQVVRGLLYHEVSHVILSGKNWIGIASNKKEQKNLNIFEDERIETILANYYINTNFKKNIILLNNYHGQAPRNADEAWYFTVRFHVGEAKWIDYTEQLINKYADLTATASRYEWREYLSDIMDFYNEFCKDWNENNEETESAPSEEDEEKSESEFQKSFFGSDGHDGDAEDYDFDENASGNDVPNDADSDDEANGSGKSDDKSDEADKKSDKESDNGEESDKMTEEEAEERANNTRKFKSAANKNQPGSTSPILRKAFENFNDFENANLTAKLAKILMMANKKKGFYSNSRSTYNSGRINPRSIKDDNYKWFIDKGHNSDKRYSKIHFNLFIDNSGSWSAELEINQLIRALNKIKSPDFDFDVITINTNIVEWPTSDAYVFEASGGTDLSNAIAPVIKKHTKAGCYNYNIVVFDGAAHGYYNTSEPFLNFNTDNTILVVDDSNKDFVKNCNTCKKKIISDNYAAHFIDAIIELLERTIC